MRLLRHDLDCTLCPLLLFQPTALFASLPSCPPRFCLGRWCCSQSHLHKNHQLPNFVPWSRHAVQTEGVHRPGRERCRDCWYLHCSAVLSIHLHDSAHLRDTRVSSRFIFDFRGFLFTHHPPFRRLDSEAIDRRRLRRSWKLHFDLGDD